jgi:hypothetical protein
LFLIIITSLDPGLLGHCDSDNNKGNQGSSIIPTTFYATFNSSGYNTASLSNLSGLQPIQSSGVLAIDALDMRLYATCECYIALITSVVQ